MNWSFITAANNLAFNCSGQCMSAHHLCRRSYSHHEAKCTHNIVTSSAKDPERREQNRENEQRHLAHQLIKWIAEKEGVGSKAKGQ